jgi:hypothetical protein
MTYEKAWTKPLLHTVRVDYDENESRDASGKWSGGAGIEKDEYGSIKTKETLSKGEDFLSKAHDAPLHLTPDHDEQTVILSHAGTHLGSAEHVNGKWQATYYSRHDVLPKHLDILNRAAPRGLRDIDPDEYTAKGERKGQGSLF